MIEYTEGVGQRLWRIVLIVVRDPRVETLGWN